MKERTLLFETIYCQIKKNQASSEQFIAQLPPSTQEGLWDQPLLLSDELSKHMETLIFELIAHTEECNRLISDLSDLMQATDNTDFLLACDQILCGYIKYQENIASYLTRCNCYLEQKNKATDCSPIYRESIDFCRRSEFFSSQIKVLLENE